MVSSIGCEDGVVNVQLCAAMLHSMYEELEPNIKVFNICLNNEETAFPSRC